MPAIHCKIEPNLLTVPETYKIRFIPNNKLMTDDIAAEMCAVAPILTPDVAKTAMSAYHQTIQKNMMNGNHVTVDDSLIYTLSFTGRLDNPDDPLPPVAETLHVRIHATANFMKEIHHQARLERVDMTEKLPQINLIENSTLQLDNILSSTDILQLHGDNLDFDPRLGNGECVITGTRSGSAVQSQFGPITDTNIILIPTIPAQDDPWNNEYTLSLSVRYTEHGTLRTSTYRSRLRSPLTVPDMGHPNPPETGILTGNAAAPYVVITGGTVTADERLRIEVLQDLTENWLLFSLLDMLEDGATGEEVVVKENGAYSLPGFADSAVSNLNITVNDYTALWDMLRNDYSGRLVDVLDVKIG
ncbi:hypothetical protein [Candidatus Electrothrix sp.]|uniref:hypothetical protein n=1 Tax=Candidatus Electrothrix sp. TaxID=2170559 RepID=UPI00405795BE